MSTQFYICLCIISLSLSLSLSLPIYIYIYIYIYTYIYIYCLLLGCFAGVFFGGRCGSSASSSSLSRGNTNPARADCPQARRLFSAGLLVSSALLQTTCAARDVCVCHSHTHTHTHTVSVVIFGSRWSSKAAGAVLRGWWGSRRRVAAQTICWSAACVCCTSRRSCTASATGWWRPPRS